MATLGTVKTALAAIAQHWGKPSLHVQAAEQDAPVHVERESYPSRYDLQVRTAGRGSAPRR